MCSVSLLALSSGDQWLVNCVIASSREWVPTTWSSCKSLSHT